MKNIKLFLSIIILALLSICCDINTNTPTDTSNTTSSNLLSNEYMVGIPIGYKNLQIFPILSSSRHNSLEYITLTKAIEKTFVEVKETGNVNQLSISNKSDKYVFILAGDIVKGGKQDRTIENDVIIAPHSRNVPLDSYCVESGRWQARGDEESGKFSENSKVLASKELKLASRYKKDQSEVWAKVAEKQEKLNRKLSQLEGNEVETRSSESQTSLQLTLESKELEKYVNEFENHLEPDRYFPENAVGFAYAINKEIYGADIFNCSDLFEAFKDKLLEAVLIEAITETDSINNYTALTIEDITEFLMINDSSKKNRNKLNELTVTIEFDATDKVLFETVNSDDSGKWVRKNFVSKIGLKEDPINQKRIKR